MAVTKTVRESWSQRLSKSLAGVLIGVTLFLLAFPLLFWNEGRAVKTAKALDEAQELCLPLETNTEIAPDNEGKLVHVTGQATTDFILRDKPFEIEVNSIRLSRRVKFYQWVEKKEKHTEKNDDGSTTTYYTYTYEKKWVGHPVDSSSFEEAGHYNTVAWHGIDDESAVADKVAFGAYQLTSKQIDRIGGEPTEFDLTDSRLFTDISEWFCELTGAAPEHRSNMGRYDLTAYELPAVLCEHVENDGQELYIHLHKGTPRPDGKGMAFPQGTEVGDMRVYWDYVGADVPISVVAVQKGKTFATFRAKSSGYPVNLLRDGTWSADEMFDDARANNAALTWFIRLFGAGMMFIGLMLITDPLEVLADRVPALGNIVGSLTMTLSFLLALVLSLITIAVAWLFYRPLLGVCLLLAAGFLLYDLMRRNKLKRALAAEKAAEAKRRKKEEESDEEEGEDEEEEDSEEEGEEEEEGEDSEEEGEEEEGEEDAEETEQEDGEEEESEDESDDGGWGSRYSQPGRKNF